MRWSRSSSVGRVEDRRGMGARGAVGGGVGILGIILALLFGQDVFGGGSGVDPRLQPFPDQIGAQGDGGLDAPDPQEEELAFVEYLDGDVQTFWQDYFEAAGQTYEPAPPLVVFSGSTQSGCGAASSAIGPFYCPLDSRVYIDLDFFRELRSRFGAPGDFAQAYVIAHEYGHHVQNVIGISDDVRQGQQANPDQANELSVRLELQADCLAGVWANSVYERGDLDPGDVEESLAAASAVGDDRIQAQATGQINPETWTHGSSEQRAEWFERGFANGDITDCDTFTG